MDAAAAGSWAQALAGFAGAGAVVYAARRGVETFKDWQGQKRAERQVEAAERILALAYRLVRDFEAVRSPAQYGFEIARAEKVLAENDPTFAHLDQGRRQSATTGQVYLTRLADLRDRWEELFACVPLAKAYFGSDAEAALMVLWTQRGKVNVAAMMIGMGDLDREMRLKMEAEIWEGVYEADGKPDPIKTAIAESVASLEGILLPLLRHGIDAPPKA